MSATHLYNIGNVEAKCPYCGHLLDKKPAQKKKCPACNNYIYVRTRPSDKEKILVTESQIPLVEQQWDFYQEQKEKEKLEENPEYVSVKQMLIKKWGKEPSLNDVKWSLANKHLIEHSQNNNWGLYRNTRLEMANILKKEKRTREALRTYLDILYIDVNGPCNRGSFSDLQKYPPFDPSQSFLAPAIITYIQELGEELKISHDEIKDIFIEIAGISYTSLKLPITPISAWEKTGEKIMHRS